MSHELYRMIRLLERERDLRTRGPWKVPVNRVPDMNRHMRGSVVIALNREAPLPIS